MVWGRPQSPHGWGALLLSRFSGEKISLPGALKPHVSLPLAWQDTERFQARSQELEHKLVSKEQELEQLVLKQKQVGCVLRHLALTAASSLALAHFPCH